MSTIHIYGINYTLPPVPQSSKILGFELPKKQQKWRRQPLPAIFDDLDFDAEGDPVYTEEQLKWINEEVDKFERGIWFYNNGAPTYITGLNYFYLQYWTLENGDPPEYRACDRRYFYFQDYCEKQSYIDGIIRSKKRREGATSQATADQVLTAITKKAAICGIVSKTNVDAKNAFQLMVRPAYKALPIMFKPDCMDEDSMTEFFFIKSKRKTKVKKGVKRQAVEDSYGLGSKIYYGPTALNTFDSGRQTKPLIDEGGKWPIDVPINEYWPIIRKTLKKGGRRVGFALMPSTSNKLTKGGKGFKLLWDESNQFERKETGSGMYRYFTPSDEGYEPYIDEYGESITSKPTIEQAKWMREHYGASELQCSMSAKEFILYQRSLIKNPTMLAEAIRMEPLNEKEAFDFETSDNIYDMQAILDQKQALKDNPVPLRQVSFFRKLDGEVDWKPDPAGHWWIYKFPEETEVRAYVTERGKRKPANKGKYVLVADPFKNTIVTGKGSNGAAIVGSKINPFDEANTGLPMGFFLGRPKLRRDFHKQMLYAAEYWGCEIGYESDYDDYIEFLEAEERMGYAMGRPDQTIDPNRKRKKDPNNPEYGMKSADGFTYSMMIDRSQVYVSNYCWKIKFMPILDQLEEYDHDERTLYDAVVALQLFSVAISEPIQKKKEKPKPKKALIKTYQINYGK